MLVYNTLKNEIADIAQGDDVALRTFLGDSQAHWNGAEAINGAGGMTDPNEYYEQLRGILDSSTWDRRVAVSEGIKRLSIAMVLFEQAQEEAAKTKK